MACPENTVSPAEIIPEIYPQLRRIAAARMAFEGAGQTLQPTALVHEAWLHLSSSYDSSWRDSSHFCAMAVETMRRILINRARRRSRIKRWGNQERVSMSEFNERTPDDDDERTLLIDAALERFAQVDPMKAKVVVLKFFGGLTNGEIAREMKVTERTIERYWHYARGWLYREIRPSL